MSDTNQTEEKKFVREEIDMDMDALLGSELKLTGADLPAGSYPGVLFAFSKPFLMPVGEKFKKPGQPEKRPVFDLRFGIFDKAGALVEVTLLAGIPDGGEVNRRSNLYKALKALAPDAFDNEGKMKPGNKLTSFLGKTCVVNIVLNKKEFPQVDGLAPPLAGAKYPDPEACKKELTGSQDVPF